MGTGVPPPPPSSSSSSLATETSNSVSTFSTGEFVLPITDTTQLDSISDQQILTPGSKLSMVSKVPLPPQKPSDKLRILHDLKDLYSSKRAIHVSSTNPPSICMFTLHNTICSTSNPSPNSNFNTIGGGGGGSSGSGNSESTLTSTAISRDFDIVAAGFSDSYIKIWNINNNNNNNNNSRDRDIDNENQQNTDSNLDTDNEYQKYKNKKLVAHSGPVYGLDIAHDNSLLVSSSADTT
ncbi:Transcription initiation factor TFIID subunit 5, partial [Zancudomyces culisetae]